MLHGRSMHLIRPLRLISSQYRSGMIGERGRVMRELERSNKWAPRLGASNAVALALRNRFCLECSVDESAFERVRLSWPCVVETKAFATLHVFLVTDLTHSYYSST